MSDATVKIISNPFSKTIEFFFLEDEWVKIDQTSNPNSKLLGRDLVEGFFPFKARDAVARIFSEYRGDQGVVAIVFEGSDDEYEELKAVCDSDEFANVIKLSRGQKKLLNARDVLPEIVDVFKSIRPLIDESVLEKERIERDLDKFNDVSSDLIPLCILGNYSAGKSTFINALIGHEILPNGDMPVTAKVFQIKRSKQRDRAHVKFGFAGQEITLKFNADGIANLHDLPQNPVCERIAKSLSEADGMIPQMNKTLQVINGFKAKDSEPAVADLIDIEVPFSQDDPWALTHDFVIFDTPGSNSASNEDHIRVLRSAMEGLSNGLPIYIAEYSSLDSKDNESLYDEIKQIEAMDERFAMIVVNKADAADLPKGSFGDDDIERIMDSAIPRHLYAQGIYFVSSILGLGSKTQGEFISDNYAEKYEDQERKYSNPDNRFYKTLYTYNILPGQISDRTNLESRRCSNLVFANSGLFCVEQEIVLFAERYSAYNKCYQSESLLRRIIGITAEEIKLKEEDCQKHQEALEQQLEEDKAKLLSDLAACGEEIQGSSIASYPLKVAQDIEAEQWFGKLEELEARESELLDRTKEEHGYSEDAKEAEDALKAVRENFGRRIGEALSSPSLETFGEAFKGLADDIDDAGAKKDKAKKTGREADIEMSENLLEEVKQEFDRRLSEINETIDEQSKAFWEERSEQGREAIYQLATSSTVLSDEKRKEVADIIIQYPALKLRSNTDEIFDKSKFDSLRLLNIMFYQSTRLNLAKVARTFNSEIERALAEIKDAVRESHEIGFTQWLEELLGKIRENITEYNPKLSRHVKLINEDKRRILELRKNLDTLQRCTASVSKMIDWRE